MRSQTPAGLRPSSLGAVNDSGAVVEMRAGYVVVRASRLAIGAARVEERGQWWSVRGPVVERRADNGFIISDRAAGGGRGSRLFAPRANTSSLPGRCNPAFEGIGTVKARRPSGISVSGSHDLPDAGDASTLATVLTPEVASSARSSRPGCARRTLQCCRPRL